MLTPPEPPRLSEQVESRLEELIVSSEFALGTRLPGERELMRQFGVSRPSVREAIRRLESRGLVRVYPSRGTYVTGTPDWGVRAQWQSWVAKDREKLLAVSEVRQMLEVGAAARAAERATDEEIAELRLAHLAFEQQLERDGSVADLSHWDKVFHHRLAVASGNEVLAAFVENLNETVSASRRSLLDDPAIAHRSYEEHSAILGAVETHDVAGAMRAVTEHIARVRDEIERLGAAEATGAAAR
jgi:GntR family transcriptional repressor for pyruvate dehydrogenase complex